MREVFNGNIGNGGSYMVSYASSSPPLVSLDGDIRPRKTSWWLKQATARLNQKLSLNLSPPLINVPIDREKMVKHFIFHMLPLRDEHAWVWRRHVEHILESLGQFNGQVIVAIAQFRGGEQLVKKPLYKTSSGKELLKFSALADVIAAFGPDSHRIRFMPVTNSNFGEGVSFPLMLWEVLSDDPNHVFCYAHSKSATHGELPPENSCHQWSEAMWETVVNNQEAIVALDDHAMAGSFRKLGSFRGKNSGNWHYSGAFFWGRCVDIYSRNWAYLPRWYSNVEMWPGIHAKPEEGACLFLDNPGKLFNQAYWEKQVIPALELWRREKAYRRHSSIGKNSPLGFERRITHLKNSVRSPRWEPPVGGHL